MSVNIFKTSLTSIIILVLIASTSISIAGHRGQNNAVVTYIEVPVVKVEPIYKHVKYYSPREQCSYTSTEYEAPSSTATVTALGGIIGAAVGHGLGHHKRNKQVGAVAGAVLGASIGHDLSHSSRNTRVRRQRHCSVINDYYEEEQVDAYRVVYLYHGKRYKTRMQRHPGKRLKIKVSMRPIVKY